MKSAKGVSLYEKEDHLTLGGNYTVNGYLKVIEKGQECIREGNFCQDNLND